MYEQHYRYFVKRYGDTRLGRWLARRDARSIVRSFGHA